MFESWFTQKCTAFVSSSGTPLAGDELSAAENAVKKAEMADLKIWTDNDGIYYVKKRSLFASAEILRDASGNPVQICNHKVNTSARFCSKCGSPAPGGWWKCSGCGEMIGNDSTSCPHCGKTQSISARQHLSDGMWVKNEEILAEFIDLEDVTVKMDNGLNVQPHQCCLFFAGGKMVERLESGVYTDGDLKEKSAPYGGKRNIVMIDKGEFPVSICVEKLYSQDNIAADLHITLTLRLGELNVNLFLQNFMGNGLTLGRGKFSNVVVYDEIARNILQFTDLLAREYCSGRTVKDFFCNSTTRKELENYLEKELFDHLKSAGMSLVRLGEVEFESEVFEELRKRTGDLEAKRRELEFMESVRELENETRRREITSESEMEDFLRESAKDKKIKEQLFEEEMAHLQRSWQLKQEIAELEHKYDIEDAVFQRENQSKLLALQEKFKEQQLLHEQKIQNRIQEQEGLLLDARFEVQLAEIRQELESKNQHHKQTIEKSEVVHNVEIDNIKLSAQLNNNEATAESNCKIQRQQSFTNDEIRMNHARTEIEIQTESGRAELDLTERKNKIEMDRLEKLIELKARKHAAAQQNNIELLKAAQGADLATLLMVTDDPAKRAELLKLHQQSNFGEMSVEKILAAGVLQGNRDAVAALEVLSKNKKHSENEQ